MNEPLLPIVILIVLSTFRPFLKKLACANLAVDEFIVLNHMVFTACIVMYLSLFEHNFSAASLRKVTKLQLIYIVCGSLMSLIGGYIVIPLLQKHDVSFIIPQLQPLIIALTVLVGCFLFGEELTTNKMLGGFIVCIGIYVLNRRNPLF